MSRALATLVLVLAVGGDLLRAQFTVIVPSTADTFVATGSATNPAGSDLRSFNYGSAGMLVVAPATSTKGEFQSLLRFDLAEVTNTFTTNLGAGNWAVTAISLELAANYGTSNVQPNNLLFPAIQGGDFIIEWLSNNNWVEGTGTPNLPATEGVTYDSLAGLLALPRETLATNHYLPPGDNVHVVWSLPLNSNVLADISGGVSLSFRFFAADHEVAYLFNSHQYGRGNEPLLHVTAVANLRLVSAQFGVSGLDLTGLGAPNTLYLLQAVTDLAGTNWLTVANATTDSTGAVHFHDSGATNFSRRFYRLSP